MVTVGTRLRIIRKDAGLSQVELGKLAGSNQSAINRYETDRAAVPYRMLKHLPGMRIISMYPWTTFLAFVMTNVGGSLPFHQKARKNMYGANRIGVSSWKLVSSQEVN